MKGDFVIQKFYANEVIPEGSELLRVEKGAYPHTGTVVDIFYFKVPADKAKKSNGRSSYTPAPIHGIGVEIK